MISNRYEYLQLMDSYAPSIGGYVMHYACRGMFSENYFKLPAYFGGDFTKNAPLTNRITFDEFSKRAGNVFCVPHNTAEDREFFRDLTRSGVLAVVPVDVDAHLTDKHAIGLVGNYSGLLGQVRFFKLLSNKNFLAGVAVKNKKKTPAFVELLRRTSSCEINTKSARKNKKNDEHKLGVFYRKAREPHRRKYYRGVVRYMQKNFSSQVRGFVFSGEERKFHEHKLSRYAYKLAADSGASSLLR